MEVETIIVPKENPISFVKQASPIVHNKIELLCVKFFFFFEFVYLITRHLKNPLLIFRVISGIKDKYNTVFGYSFLSKIAKVDGKYYWKLSTPKFPSISGRRLRANEINRIIPFKEKRGLRTVIFSITNTCPLNCEHCYEADSLNKSDKLSTADRIKIMHKYQEYGATQIVFSGGEPLSNIKEIYTLLEKKKKGTDFWIVSSGWNLTEKKAIELKRLGLTGILISIDSHLAAEHNAFRRNESSYNKAIEAVLASNKAKLVTGLSLCTTQKYTTKKNIKAYLDFAKNLGVSYVQIWEPKAAGNYQNMEVALDESQIKILEEFYLDYNSNPKYKDYPIINYVDYFSRRMGCMGKGEYFLYIDADGDIHPCPVCKNKLCNSLENEADKAIDMLKELDGCLNFD